MTALTPEIIPTQDEIWKKGKYRMAEKFNRYKRKKDQLLVNPKWGEAI